jgi:hypothetical protein
LIVAECDDAFANFEGKIQAGEFEIAMFELLDDAKGVKVVISVTMSSRSSSGLRSPRGQTEVANIADQGQSLVG